MDQRDTMQVLVPVSTRTRAYPTWAPQTPVGMLSAMSDDPNRSPRPGETNLSAKNSAASAAAVFAGLQRGLELQGGSVFDLADVVLTALLELGIEMDVGAALVETVASKAP